MIKAGLIGSSGYVAGELLRILLNHPYVEIDFIYSHSSPDQNASTVHEDLLPYPQLRFTSEINPEIDILFLCLGHGHSSKFLSKHTFSKSTRIIDLGSDFRLEKEAQFGKRSFVYGLAEANKNQIQDAQNIANPGCFATAIQLALLPLACNGLLQSELHIHAITGSTGAGKELSDTSHFSWRNNNVSIYKAFQHQHLHEIGQTMRLKQKGFDQSLHFLPVRGGFTRGIFASAYTQSLLAEDELMALYKDFYKEAPFTFLSENKVHLKQVVNTNNCFLQVQQIEGKVLVTSVIDNLLKGASGQAVHNMNLMFGLEETLGLQLKPSYF